MFRFTIRELVLLTMVVAMGVGWWLDHLQQVRRQEAARIMLYRWTPKSFSPLP